MKNLIFAILILSAMTAWFSFRGEIVPLESQKEGWAFFGTSGEPIPSEGADGQMDVFTSTKSEPDSVNEPEQDTAKAQPKSPITVSVVKPDKEKSQAETFPWDTFWCGVGVGALAAEIGMLLPITICWLKSHKRRNHHEKRKNRP